MPPRSKRQDDPTTAEIETDRPGHLAELCGECGAPENGGSAPHPTATSFACEHGSWTFPAGNLAEVLQQPATQVDPEWLVEQMRAAGATDDVITKVLEAQQG